MRKLLILSQVVLHQLRHPNRSRWWYPWMHHHMIHQRLQNARRRNLRIKVFQSATLRRCRNSLMNSDYKCLVKVTNMRRNLAIYCCNTPRRSQALIHICRVSRASLHQMKRAQRSLKPPQSSSRSLQESMGSIILSMVFCFIKMIQILMMNSIILESFRWRYFPRSPIKHQPSRQEGHLEVLLCLQVPPQEAQLTNQDASWKTSKASQVDQ